MGLRGVIIGGIVGDVFGRQPGALVGAILGHLVEERYFRRRERPRSESLRREDPLAAAYAVLGAEPSDSDEDLRRRYRDLAKRHHPDVLRGKGLPEAEIVRAAARMTRLNEAWNAIRTARGL